MDPHRITEADVNVTLSHLDTIWPVLIPAEQATLVQSMVESIIIDANGKCVYIPRGIHALVSELDRYVVKEGVHESDV